MVEGKQRNDANDFPFPTSPEESQEPASYDFVGLAFSPTAGDRDIVDTNWDIPMIEFPAEFPITQETDIESRESAERSAAPARAAAGARHVDLDFTPLPEFSSQTASGSQNDHSAEDAASPAVSAGSEAANNDAVNDAVTASYDFGSILAGSAVTATAGEDSHDVASVAEPPAHHSTDSCQHRHRRVIWLVTLVAIALVAVGSLVWVRHSRVVRREAVGECTAAASEYNTASRELSAALHDSSSTQAATPRQVMDSTTITALQGAVNTAKNVQRHDSTLTCDASLSLDELKSQAATARSMTPTIRSAAGKVTNASLKVTESKAQKDAKTAADISSASSALSQAVASSEQLLDGSLYQVADNTTRITLQNAIAVANALLEQNSRDLSAIQQSLTDLQTADAAVNNSMAALTAQNQAQAQLQTQQPQPQPQPRSRVQTSPQQPSPDVSTDGQNPDGSATKTNPGQK